MSILIRGMAMPKNCDDCFAEAFGYCRALKYNPSEPDFRAISDSMTRREDCPLIEVPKHGRLIDADAMIKKMIEEGWADGCGWADALDIALAPTIIEME